MRKPKKSLLTWCRENNRKDLLDEWNENKSNTTRAIEKPKTVKYDDPRNVWWKCKEGHEWQTEVVARTVFGRMCPICNKGMDELPVGSKYGCLTIIGGYEVYQKEVEEKIEKIKIEKEDYIKGDRKPNSLGFSMVCYDKRIEQLRSERKYLVQCKCGLKHFYNQGQILSRKHRYCTQTKYYKNQLGFAELKEGEDCGLRIKQQKRLLDSFDRIYDESYDVDFTHTFHDSLEVLECIDDHYEELYGYEDKRKLGGGAIKVYKQYKCRCYLCEEELIVKSSDFSIKQSAFIGFHSGACCICRQPSSFEWIVNKILKEHNVLYRVEKEFPDLYGQSNTSHLRFDFAVLNPDGTIKWLIECQGEQHYRAVEEFGGKEQFEIQKKNDELKRGYAKKHGIKLLEISYKDKKYENVERILRENSII